MIAKFGFDTAENEPSKVRLSPLGAGFTARVTSARFTWDANHFKESSPASRDLRPVKESIKATVVSYRWSKVAEGGRPGRPELRALKKAPQ